MAKHRSSSAPLRRPHRPTLAQLDEWAFNIKCAASSFALVMLLAFGFDLPLASVLITEGLR